MDFSKLWLFDSPFKHIVLIFTLFDFEIHDLAPLFNFFNFFGLCFDVRIKVGQNTVSTPIPKHFENFILIPPPPKIENLSLKTQKVTWLTSLYNCHVAPYHNKNKNNFLLIKQNKSYKKINNLYWEEKMQKTYTL